MWHMISNYVVANWIELAGFLTTWVGIWLTTKRLLICWPIVLAADIFYLVVFYRANLRSDAWLQVFFILFTLYGWWNWVRGVREDGEVCIEPLGVRGWLGGLAAGAAGSVLLGVYMQRHGASLPYLDATLAIYSLVASWWQARKHVANWWLWIVIDGVYIAEYAYKDLWLTAVLSAGLVILAVMGLLDWRRAPTAIQRAA